MGADGLTATVVGGGIAGLASAVALAQAGWRVTVLERAPAFGEVGAGLATTGNGMTALAALGLGEASRRGRLPDRHRRHAGPGRPVDHADARHPVRPDRGHHDLGTSAAAAARRPARGGRGGRRRRAGDRRRGGRRQARHARRRPGGGHLANGRHGPPGRDGADRRRRRRAQRRASAALPRGPGPLQRQHQLAGDHPRHRLRGPARPGVGAGHRVRLAAGEPGRDLLVRVLPQPRGGGLRRRAGGRPRALRGLGAVGSRRWWTPPRPSA